MATVAGCGSHAPPAPSATHVAARQLHYLKTHPEPGMFPAKASCRPLPRKSAGWPIYACKLWFQTGDTGTCYALRPNDNELIVANEHGLPPAPCPVSA